MTRKVRSRTPPKACIDTLFSDFFLIVFSSAALSVFFVILSAPRLHFSSHFDSLVGALGLWKNLQNCVTVIKFSVLTPSKHGPFAGLARGSVLMMFFFAFVFLSTAQGAAGKI